MGDSLYLAAEALGRLLQARHWQLSTAESCTGGGVAAALTAVAGSSDWFGYGWVTYANSAKIRQLQVDQVALDEQGAVSARVAQQMAQGARLQSGSDWALATTGIAGPGGGSETKPVGTVWFAWAGPEGYLCAESQHFSGDRQAIREAAVLYALTRLVDQIKNTV